jgi:hypothetical protein
MSSPASCSPILAPETMDNDAKVLAAIEAQLAHNVQMLCKPVVSEVASTLSVKIDRLLGVLGVRDFQEYYEIFTEQSRQGKCAMQQLIQTSHDLSVSNLGMTVDAIINLVNSKSYVLEVSQFLESLLASFTTTLTDNTSPHPVHRGHAPTFSHGHDRFWKVQQTEMNGDFKVVVVSLVAAVVKCSASTAEDIAPAKTCCLNLKVDLLGYVVPGELVLNPSMDIV